jgi:hypothetical protein
VVGEKCCFKSNYMKAIIAVVLITLLAPIQAFAQTQINKSIAVSAGQNVVIHFDYPELIRVSTWDKNEVSIQGTVSINSGENDDAFELFTSSSGNTVSIRNEIKDLKNLPHRYTIVDGAQKITFKNRAELKKYQDQNGRQFEMMSSGVDMEIILEIKVPRNVKTKVESVYGMVEIKDFVGPLDVESTYGGVDAALTERATGMITAETNYGEIYTNLDTKFGGDSKTRENFHTYVSAKPGSGPEYSFESKYGNVYIRKAN